MLEMALLGPSQGTLITKSHVLGGPKTTIPQMPQFVHFATTRARGYNRVLTKRGPETPGIHPFALRGVGIRGLIWTKTDTKWYEVVQSGLEVIKPVQNG